MRRQQVIRKKHYVTPTVRRRARLAATAEGLREILGPFETPVSFEADFFLDVRHQAEAFPDIPPDGMEEHWRGTLPDGPPAVCYRGPSERATLLPGLARMLLTERGADVRVAPGAEWCLNLGCILPALCDLLARRGHYVVHAATLCAANPPGGSPVPPALLLWGRAAWARRPPPSPSSVRASNSSPTTQRFSIHLRTAQRLSASGAYRAPARSIAARWN